MHTIKDQAFEGGDDAHEAPGDDVESVFASLAYLFDGARSPVEPSPRGGEAPPGLEPEEASDDEPTRVRPDPLGWATTRSTSL
jgi:hypothetical protein